MSDSDCGNPHYEEDMEYLRQVDMRGLLQALVADAMEDQPEDVYRYLGEWAAQRREAEIQAAGGIRGESEEAHKQRLMAGARSAVLRRMPEGDSASAKATATTTAPAADDDQFDHEL